MTNDGATGKGLLRRAGRRLWRSRWLVAASCLAVLAANGISGGPAAVALGGCIFVAAAAALIPSGDAAEEGEDGPAAHRAGAGRVSAVDLAAAVSDPVILFDKEGVVAHANAAAHGAFGSLESGASLLLRFRSPEMQHLLRRLLQHPDAVEQADYLERVPVERAYRVSGRPAGNSGLMVLTFRDQSEARRIDRMRADFVANASHELRTPLASIAGFIDTLRGPARDDPTAREKFLQIMQDQTARMARLIDDLLSLSRLEMKALIDPNAKVDVAEAVTAVMQAFAPLAAESGVSVTRDFSDRPALVAGSRDELIQVFENLLENAFKYGQSGGAVTVSIEEAGAGKNREIRVTVRDFGPGIAEEHIPRLTERFYRVEVEASRAQKGTGLGLAIVKHILTRHGGYLSVKSSPGEGAAFVVHLPAA